ncbi:uncharacterized protein LOC120214833 [Hibiscus syriacus]|uniref:uncharacterized protein LOC120214833 n=1 Tax=Hibiscus syriacus TaxID=106335 RepID=UPI00192358EC|nr:uncharacterized protein LOC120214833 [Hibiscus syriacus]
MCISAFCSIKHRRVAYWLNVALIFPSAFCFPNGRAIPLRARGKPFDHCSPVFPLILCKSQLCFAWCPCAVAGINADAVCGTSDLVHFEHSSTKTVAHGKIHYPTVG